MSIKAELLASKKLSFAFQQAIVRLNDAIDADTVLGHVAVRTFPNREDVSAKVARIGALNGVKVNTVIGDIVTAQVSLNGLKNLADSDDVSVIDSSGPVLPPRTP